MKPTFSQKLAIGKLAETQIALWLRRAKGWDIVPIYEQEAHNNKGPRFFTADSEIAAPDILAMKDAQVRWIEAKHKTVFSWRGNGGYWETGIDLHYYEEYQRIAARHPWPVWLLFLHKSDRTDQRDIERWGAPPTCPTGLFGGTIAYLKRHENHTDPTRGRLGMVYWRYEALQLLATLDEVYAVAPSTQGLDTLRTIAGR